MDKIVEQFVHYRSCQTEQRSCSQLLRAMQREPRNLAAADVHSMLCGLQNMIAAPIFQEKTSPGTQAVNDVIDNLGDAIHSFDDNSKRQMHSKYTDLYIAFLQAGPTGGHLACLKDIHESIERYLEQNATDDEISRIINAYKLDLSKENITLDKDYASQLTSRFGRLLRSLDEPQFGRLFTLWLSLYNHCLLTLHDTECDTPPNIITVSFLSDLRGSKKLDIHKRYLECQDKNMCVSQLKVIEEAVSRIRGPRVTRVCDELQGALKHVLDLLSSKEYKGELFVDETMDTLIKLIGQNTETSRHLAKYIVEHSNKGECWKKSQVDIAGKYLPELIKVVEEGSSNDYLIAYHVIQKSIRYLLPNYIKTADHGVHLLSLMNTCVKKRHSDYMDVFERLLNSDYDKVIKWKTNAEWCRTILRTLLLLDDVIEAEVEEKELAQLYKYHDNSFRHLLDNKLEKFRMLPAVSEEMVLLMEKAVLHDSKLHIYSMRHAHQKVVWKNHKDKLVSVVRAVCDYVNKPDDFMDVVAEYYDSILRYCIRAAIDMKIEMELRDILLGTLQTCVGKPGRDECDKTSVYYALGSPILTEFCWKIMEQADVGSKFVPTIVKIGISEPDDDLAEQMITHSQSILRFISAYPKTVAPHADVVIDAMVENDIEDGLLAIAWASYQTHSEKINPRLDALIDKAQDDDRNDQCYLLQLLHLVVKKHPELWSDKVHAKVMAAFEEKTLIGLCMHCLTDVYSQHPSRMIADMDFLIAGLKRESVYINMLYQVFPIVAAVSEAYARKVLASLDDLMSSNLDLQIQRVLLMSYRSIASTHRPLVAERRAMIEKKMELSTLSESCSQLLDFLDGKSLDDVYQEVDTQRKDISVLDTKVTRTQADVKKVTKKVDKHGRDIKHIKEDVTKAEVKLDTLTDSVQEMGQKVEEIDHKTLDHAPAWSRDVSVLLNPESAHDWRLLAQRLGYSKADIRGWATQADPCMAMLNEWFATHKTSEAVHGVHKALLEMNRTDAADIVKKAMDAAGNIIEDDSEDNADPPPVFISYQWGHQAEVKLLKRHLEMAGFKAWMDIGQMGGGDKLFAKIDQGMRAAKVIICCVTDKYAKSDNCTREVNLAVTVGKPIIPLLMEKSQWPPEGAMGPIFGEYLFIRFWQRGEEVTSPDDQRYWPLMKFSELLMQIRLYIAPDLSILGDGYKDWCSPPDEKIEIKSKTSNKGEKSVTKDVKKKEETKSQPQVTSQPSEQMSTEVFISYQWGKQPQIRKLYQRLTDLGFSCWMDIHQMGGGDSLYEKIDKGIRGCTVVISCCTKKYSLSANCRREVSLADALKKPIVPLLLEDMPWPPEGAMSMVFTQLLYINFSKDLNLQEVWSGDQFDDLLKRISKHAKPTTDIPGKKVERAAPVMTPSVASKKEDSKAAQPRTDKGNKIEQNNSRANTSLQPKGAKIQTNRTEPRVTVKSERAPQSKSMKPNVPLKTTTTESKPSPQSNLNSKAVNVNSTTGSKPTPQNNPKPKAGGVNASKQSSQTNDKSKPANLNSTTATKPTSQSNDKTKAANVNSTPASKPTSTAANVNKENPPKDPAVPVKQPDDVQASVKFMGSKKAFDAGKEWRKVKNVKTAASAFNSKHSQACYIL